ncbi:MAG: EamA family transporter [Steroidobacteraceae bacterium]
MHTVTVTPAGRYQRALPFVALLVAIVSVQFGAAFSKQLFPVLGVERTTFLRLLLGAVLLAPIFKPWRMRIARRQWPLLLLFSASIATMNLCFYLAIQRIPLGVAVALEFIGPLGLAIGLSHRRMDLIWVALAVIGLFLLLPISQAFHASAHPLDSAGVLFALLAAAAWAAYGVLGKHIGTSLGPGIIALAMACAAVIMLPIAALQSGTVVITPHLAVAAVIVGLFSSALPFSLEMIAINRMPVRTYGTFTSLDPVFGTVMGLVVLRELPATAQLAGIAAIVIASVGTAVFGE